MTAPARRLPLVPVLVVLALVTVACTSAGRGERNRVPATPGTPTAPDTIAPAHSPSLPTRGVLVAGARGVAIRHSPGGNLLGRLRTGVVLPFDARDGGFVRVTTPCERTGWAALAEGRVRGSARVVVDPGHGGDETGAVGPGGLREAPVNLDVGRRVVDLLEARGISAVLTRTADYRATLAFRVQVAAAVGARALVSIHHNAEPDEVRGTPGTESFFQYRSPESKRLTGLVQEEVFRAYDRYDVTFAADFDAGAKWRLGEAGRDYYGLLRRSFAAGIPATLVEGAFISNPEEEALLRRDDVRQAEAEAIARALVRFFAGEEPGDVFTVPYPRRQPAGPGGGPQGCHDPLANVASP